MGWGNNVHVRLQTHALSWGRALVGGVGWGNNVQFRLQTHALSWGRALVGWGGVAWGNNIQFRLQTHALSWGRALVAHIFFNFFVCIFCEMIGKLYLTTKNDANEKTHSIFNVLIT